jgi:hypothetical protein
VPLADPLGSLAPTPGEPGAAEPDASPRLDAHAAAIIAIASSNENNDIALCIFPSVRTDWAAEV